MSKPETRTVTSRLAPRKMLRLRLLIERKELLQQHLQRKRAEAQEIVEDLQEVRRDMDLALTLVDLPGVRKVQEICFPTDGRPDADGRVPVRVVIQNSEEGADNEA